MKKTTEFEFKTSILNSEIAPLSLKTWQSNSVKGMFTGSQYKKTCLHLGEDVLGECVNVRRNEGSNKVNLAIGLVFLEESSLPLTFPWH